MPIRSKDYFKALAILHSALMIGLILFSGIVIILKQTGASIHDTELNGLFTYFVPTIVFISVIISVLFFRSRLVNVRNSNTFLSKTTGYRAALIVKYSFLDFAALFSVISVFLTGNYQFFAYTAVMAAFLFYNRPSVKKIVNDLQLSEKEAAILEDPEGIIE